jgi:acetyltransferase-like isoleucine patch superfamily enzyme
MPMPQTKSMLSAPLALCLRLLAAPIRGLRRLWAFAALRAALKYPLPASTVVLGRVSVYGTGRVRCGSDLLLYPDLHFETQDTAEIELGDGVVISTGVHLVAMAGVRIGNGTMIGEYTSIRDANHTRMAGSSLRGSGHVARPIAIGSEVWIGRGVAILGGVSVGDGATIGANAVITHDVPAGAVVAGVPARPIASRAHAEARHV